MNCEKTQSFLNTPYIHTPSHHPCVTPSHLQHGYASPSPFDAKTCTYQYLHAGGLAAALVRALALLPALLADHVQLGYKDTVMWDNVVVETRLRM